MANQDYDREIINPLERPLSEDLNIAQSQLDRSLRDMLRALFATAAGVVQNGFISNGLKVTENSPVAMSVLVQPGLGFKDDATDVPTAISGITGLDDRSPYKPLPLSAAQAIAIDAAPVAGQNRIDIIEVKVDRRVENPTNRDILNVVTGLFAPGLVNKTLAFDLLGRNGRVVSPANSVTGIGYKVGVAAAAGAEVAPATSPGYVKLCQILVVGGVANIVNADIADFRSLIGSWAFLNLANTWAALQTFAAGVVATGPTPNGIGVDATGSGNLHGVRGTGGGTSGSGVVGTGGAPNGKGVDGAGTGTGAGVTGTGGATNGVGVSGAGTGTGAGVNGTGGATSGDGVKGTGGAANGRGGRFTGAGNGEGATCTSSGSGAAISGSCSGTGPGVRALAGNANRAPLNVQVQAADPATPADGDVWINSTSAELKYRTGGLVYRVVGVNP